MTLILKEDQSVDYKATYEHCHQYHAGYRNHNNGVDFMEYWMRDIKEPVLEIGCGNGQLCEKLQEQGHQVLGVDVAEGGYERSYPFLLYDITETPWPFDDQQFGTLLAFDVLEHIESGKIGLIIKEMVRVSKDQILSIPDRKGTGRLHVIIQPCEQWLEWLRAITDSCWRLVTTINKWKEFRQEEVHTGIFIRNG